MIHLEVFCVSKFCLCFVFQSHDLRSGGIQLGVIGADRGGCSVCFYKSCAGRSAAALLCCCQGDEDVVGNLVGNGHSGGHTDDGIVLVQLYRNCKDTASAADICHVFVSVCFYISVIRTAKSDGCIRLSVCYGDLAAGDAYLSGTAREGKAVRCVNAVCQCGRAVYLRCSAAQIRLIFGFLLRFGIGRFLGRCRSRGAGRFYNRCLRWRYGWGLGRNEGWFRSIALVVIRRKVSGLFQAGRCNRDGSVVPFAALYCMSCYSKFLIKCLYRDFKLHSGFGFTV